jgi:hypothetical protein
MQRLAQAVALAALVAGGSAAAAAPDFGTVVDNLDRRKVTKMHAQQYCKDIRGTEVSWSGAVHDVKGGRRNVAKLYLANRSRPVYSGYNIVVVTSDTERAAAAKKGQTVKFRGQIDRCSLKDNGAIIEVDNATLR